MMVNKIDSSINVLVRGLKDGGCSYVTNFPGFNSHHIFAKLGGKQISTNERIAFELAYGASMSGKRSVISFKGVGLNVAADNFLHSIINGVNAGMVVVLTDDIEAESSPESQDSRPYRDIFGGLWLEPATIQQAYEFGYQAFDWSEKLDVPIVIRLTNKFFHLTGKYETKSKKNTLIPLEKRRDKYISYWKNRDDHLRVKLTEIDLFVEKLNPCTVEFTKNKGVIAIGCCDYELNKFFKNTHDVLHLFTYPIPQKTIKKFAQGKSEITVLEQGSNYVFRQITPLVDFSCKLISIINDRPDRSKDWIIWNNLEKFFKTLKEIKPSFVVGDEGSFTDESTKGIQVCLAMGSSIGIAAGLAENGCVYPFCIVGDTSFTFSGQQTLIEARERGLNFGIVVIDNNSAKSTGGQKKIGNIYNVGDIPNITIDYEKVSKNQLFNILLKMKTKGRLSILYLKTK